MLQFNCNSVEYVHRVRFFNSGTFAKVKDHTVSGRFLHLYLMKYLAPMLYAADKSQLKIFPLLNCIILFMYNKYGTSKKKTHNFRCKYSLFVLRNLYQISGRQLLLFVNDNFIVSKHLSCMRMQTSSAWACLL